MKDELLRKLGRAAYDAECDMTHYWRCGAWADEKGDRRTRDPNPADENCNCGLKEITELVNAVYQIEKEEEPTT